MSRLTRVHLTPLLLVVMAGLGGCQTEAQRQAEQAVASYYVGDFRQSEAMLAPLARKTNEDFVLNNARLGSAALAAYDIDAAEGALLDAYEVINSVGVNNGGRTLGATVVSESIKVWKGEPFERAMVNFYLGLAYYMRHDYNNARACFENALFKLRDYGKGDDKNDSYKEQESDFALAYLMLAKCHQRLGNDDAAAKNFQRAVALRPDLARLADPERNDRSNILLVVDFGRGPEKVTSQDGALAGFKPTPEEEGPIPMPVVFVDGQQVELHGADRAPVDLLGLAQDKRWESIDTIRAVKSALGTGLIVAGAAYAEADERANPVVALGLILSGLLLKASSQADVRQWEMLPRTTFIIPLTLTAGKHDVTIDFPAAAGIRQEWHGLDVPGDGEATYYFRMLRYAQGPYSWPPPPPNVSPMPVSKSP